MLPLLQLATEAQNAPHFNKDELLTKELMNVAFKFKINVFNGATHVSEHLTEPDEVGSQQDDQTAESVGVIKYGNGS